jgi:Protein of unknown function (DUF1826)
MMLVQWQTIVLLLILCVESTESWFVQPVAHPRVCSSITVMRQSSAAPALQRLWPFSSTASLSDEPSTAHRCWCEADFDEDEQINMLIITRDSSGALPDSADLNRLVQQCAAFKRELTVSATRSDAWTDDLLQLLIANPEYSSQTSVDWLKRDITHTARQFEASLARRDSGAAQSGQQQQQQQTYELIVKLEVIDSKTLCPNFHVDKVDRRLICTYVGPGKLYQAQFISCTGNQYMHCECVYGTVLGCKSLCSCGAARYRFCQSCRGVASYQLLMTIL